jgi:hypothetical protein
VYQKGVSRLRKLTYGVNDKINGDKNMANSLLAKLKKEKAFLDILEQEHKADEWLSTNCISVNLLLSGKIQGRN